MAIPGFIQESNLLGGVGKLLLSCKPMAITWHEACGTLFWRSGIPSIPTHSAEKSWENCAIIPHTSPPILCSKTRTPHISAREERVHQIDGKHIYKISAPLMPLEEPYSCLPLNVSFAGFKEGDHDVWCQWNVGSCSGADGWHHCRYN